MTRAAETSVPAPSGQRAGVVGWLRSKDPDLLVVKRSVRAAIVMPSVFAITHVAFSNPQVSLFAAFGSFALLLLVEFTGRARARLVSYRAVSTSSGAASSCSGPWSRRTRWPPS